jgi:hypothetical protein
MLVNIPPRMIATVVAILWIVSATVTRRDRDISLRRNAKRHLGEASTKVCGHPNALQIRSHISRAASATQPQARGTPWGSLRVATPPDRPTSQPVSDRARAALGARRRHGEEA